jgi:hypothetical protein
MVANIGECALELAGKARAKQDHRGLPIAGTGDQLRVAAFVSAVGADDGSTIEIAVHFPVMPTVTVVLDLPGGDYAYTQLISTSLDITEPPNRVLTTIKKVGAGTLTVDDVQLLSVANGAL